MTGTKAFVMNGNVCFVPAHMKNKSASLLTGAASLTEGWRRGKDRDRVL